MPVTLGKHGDYAVRASLDRVCLVFCVRGGVRGVSPFYQMAV
jgi:hypothetical protein